MPASATVAWPPTVPANPASFFVALWRLEIWPPTGSSCFRPNHSTSCEHHAHHHAILDLSRPKVLQDFEQLDDRRRKRTTKVERAGFSLKIAFVAIAFIDT